MKKISEDYCQVYLVSFLKKLQKIEPVFEFWAVPNGGHRSAASASVMKLTGLLPGVFDITIIGEVGKIVFVENKLTTNTLSPVQIKFKETLDKFGFKNFIVFADTPQSIIHQYGKIMHEFFNIPQNSISKSSQDSLRSLE